ncbi:MAG: hypothetical protein EA371_05455 [Gammaproteobacteria bacterium]|nr:MAG: hypothetical protein EA371_05455 [Gammaproteobacteria bacterium]
MMPRLSAKSLLPALIEDGRLDPRHAELLARYWDERDSTAVNLEAIGYWLEVCGRQDAEIVELHPRGA